MKIFKTVLCSAAVGAVLVYGCNLLYRPGGAADISAEEMLPEEQETIATEAAVTEPSADKQMSLTEEKTVSFSFLGDCILASNAGDIRKDRFDAYAEEMQPSYFFEKAVPYLEQSDFVAANCEFVMSDKNLARTSKNGTAFWFKAPVSRTEILKNAGIDIVTLANNHTWDYGQHGYNDTTAALDAAGISWGDLDNPVYVEKDDIIFGIICTNLFNENYTPMVTPVIEEVKQNSDIQILLFHGGEEKSHVPEEWLVKICRQFADAGVDLIVGSHPHVLRPMEEYNGVDIIYSLGNFCYGGNRLPENRTVILTEEFRFDKNGNYIDSSETFTPFYVYGGSHNNWQPVPVSEPTEISKTLAFMYGASPLPY